MKDQISECSPQNISVHKSVRINVHEFRSCVIIGAPLYCFVHLPIFIHTIALIFTYFIVIWVFIWLNHSIKSDSKRFKTRAPQVNVFTCQHVTWVINVRSEISPNWNKLIYFDFDFSVVPKRRETATQIKIRQPIHPTNLDIGQTNS